MTSSFSRLRLPLSLLLVVGCATAGGDADSSPVTIDASPDIDAPGDPPDADTCPGDPCQILPQCGCSGQVCDIDPENLATGGSHCRDVSAPGDESASCSALTQCAAGHVCLGGQCRAYCSEDAPCSNTGAHCILEPMYQVSPDVYEPIPGVVTCTKTCSPELAADNGCPSSPNQFGCHLRRENPDDSAEDNGDEFYYTDCTTSAGRGNDEDCSDLGDSSCAPGFECVAIGTTQVCKQLCVWPGGSCATGSCNAFADPKPLIDGIEYGVCQ